MTSYLIRRAMQMVLVVLLATIAIFGLLNAVPGGPLSGLNTVADAKSRLSPEQIARIAQTLGLNKPFYLAYLTWLLGEDWVDEVGNTAMFLVSELSSGITGETIYVDCGYNIMGI